MSKTLLSEYREQILTSKQKAQELPAGDVRANINKVIDGVLALIMRADAHFDRTGGKGSIYNELLDQIETGLDKVRHTVKHT